jgi:hypothetical protein
MAATFDEVADAYLDNADFEEAGSVAKAKAFVTACVRLLVLLPASASDQGSAQSFDQKEIQANKQRAQAYIAANASGARTRFLSVNTGGFR